VKKFRTEYEQHITEKRCPFGSGHHGHSKSGQAATAN
jgi:hypothetical protein